MKANETKLSDFLAQDQTKFVIPVYQRNYDWKKEHCEALLADIIRVGRDPSEKAHFVGSMVSVLDDAVYTTNELKELVVIDGQQRLTSITLLLIAIYKTFVSSDQEMKAARINETYLINKFSNDELKMKLKATENNQKALEHILSSQSLSGFSEPSQIIENFKFFNNRVNRSNVDDVVSGFNKLMFVDIRLDRDQDSPQRIFESLNSTGLDLSQSDLIRNYVLMELEPKAQTQTYNDFWKVVEGNTTSSDGSGNYISEFMRDYLTIRTGKITNKNKVYQLFKDHFPQPRGDKLRQALPEILRYSELFRYLMSPNKHPESEIALRLGEINDLEMSVSYPFLLQVLSDLEEGTVSVDGACDVLDLVQTFAWRRFVCGLPTNALNKVFMDLHKWVDGDAYFDSVQSALLEKRGQVRMPGNAEFYSSLRIRDFYGIKSKSRNYFFKKLENFKNKEVVDIEADHITVEHIFPQKPSVGWKESLSSEEISKFGDIFLNTIGNLTLVGQNASLGNRTFREKCDLNIDGGEQGYRYSRLWLNRSLPNFAKWDEKSYNERTDQIVERCGKIWHMPNTKTSRFSGFDEAQIRDLGDPTDLKVEYFKFSGKKLEVSSVKEFLVEVLKMLYDLDKNIFGDPAISARLDLQSSDENLRKPGKIDDGIFIETNTSNLKKFKQLQSVLEYLDLEDELLVKVSN